MSDQPKPIAFQQAGQPDNALPQAEQGTQSPQGAVTLDQVRRVAEEIAESKFRQAQGLIDKADSRITKKVQGELQTLEKTLAMQKQLGLEVPPEKVSQMQQQIIARAYAESDAPAPAQPYAQQPAQAAYHETGTDPVTAAAYKIMQRQGVIIDDSDPEVGMLDMSDPDLFLASVGTAVQAKKARLGRPVTPTNAGAQGTAQSLEQQYKAELKAASGKPNAVAELKNKYRRLGLDVW